jgi:hypothetical protein
MATPDPRSEPSLELQTQRDLDDKVALARGVIIALERALRSRRLYEPEHPACAESAADLMKRFDGFFKAYSYLRLEITEAELRFAGRALLKCDPREPEVPFRLYKDGLRELRFHRGLTPEEIASFLTLLDFDSRQLAEMTSTSSPSCGPRTSRPSTT